MKTFNSMRSEISTQCQQKLNATVSGGLNNGNVAANCREITLKNNVGPNCQNCAIYCHGKRTSVLEFIERPSYFDSHMYYCF